MSTLADDGHPRMGIRGTTPLPPITRDVRRSSQASSSGQSRPGSAQKVRPESAHKPLRDSNQRRSASPALSSGRALSRTKDRQRDENSTGLFLDSGAGFTDDGARKVLGLADNRVNAGRVKGLTQQPAMVPFPPDSQSKGERNTPRKQRHSSGSEQSRDKDSAQKQPLSFLKLNDQSFRNLAQQIAEEIMERGPNSREASSLGSAKESTGVGGSAFRQSRDQAALLSTAKSTAGASTAGAVTAGAVTAGASRRRLQEALQEAGLRSLAEKLSLEAAHNSSAEGSSVTVQQGSASRLTPARAQSRERSSEGGNSREGSTGEKKMSEEKVGTPKMTRADLERQLQGERERREAEVAAVRKEAAERAKKLQRHVRKTEEEKIALQDRVSAASTDRADAQRALIGASEEVSILTAEHQKAVAEAQRLAAENEALRRNHQELERELERADEERRERGREWRARQEVERELGRARSEKENVERENGRLVTELAAMGARQGDQAAKLALFEAQMREHRERVLAAERVMEGFRQGSGLGDALARVKTLEKENAAKQERIEELERQILEGDAEESALQERLERLQSEADGLRAENERLKEGGEMRRDLEAALSRAQGVQDELKKERAGGAVLRQEASGLRTRVGVLEETLQAVEEEQERSTKETNEKERLWREGNAERQEKIAALERELADAQEEIQAGERKLLASARKESQTRVELREARERCAELAARVEILEKAKATSEAQFQRARADEGRASGRAERALKELEKERGHVAELTSRLTSAEGAAAEERQRFEGLKAGLLAKIETGRGRIEDLERECEVVRAAAEKAERVIETLGADVKEREAENVELRGTERALKAELSTAVEARRMYENEAEGLRVLVNETQLEVKRLTAALAESEAEFRALEGRERVAQERIGALEENRESGRLREAGLSQRVSELEQKAEDNKRLEAEARDRVAEAVKETERLKGSLAGLEKELRNATGELKRLRWSENEARNLLEMGGAAQRETAERAMAAEGRAAALSERLRASGFALSELEAKLEEAELERAKKVADGEERVAGLIARVAEADEKLSECREGLRATSVEKSALEEQCKGLQERLAAARAEFERLMGDVERKRNEQAAELGAALASAEARADASEEEVARLVERVKGLEDGLARANAALVRATEEGGLFEGEIVRLQGEVERLVGVLGWEQKECEALRTRVGDLEQELLEREGQLSILRSQGDTDYYITPQKAPRGGRF